MYTMIKKMTVVALVLLMLVMSVFVPIKKTEAAMMYNNTLSALIQSGCTSDGTLQVGMTAIGIKGKTTRIQVELYVEKRILGIFWSRVDIGCTNNVWTDSTTSYQYNRTFSTTLPSSGTFRTTATFTVSGTGGSDDIIVCTDTTTN